MNTILELLFTLNVAGSVVVACILLLRLLPTDAFPTKWRYGLSKMSVGFYLLPVALVLQCLGLLFTPKQNPSLSGLPMSVQQIQTDLSKVAIPELNFSADIALAFLSMWGIGALVFAAWQVYCYRTFVGKLQQTRIPVPENSEAARQLTLMKEVLGMRSNVHLAYSSAVRSPVLVGLWKPTIYLPMENTADMDMSMVIRHELTHLKRKDIWVKAFAMGASAIHWFNPLVHILRKDIQTWSELSCDEEVVKKMSYAERKRYGETILNVMEGSRNLPMQFCAFLSSDGKKLKRRLIMMLSVKKLKRQTVIFAATAIIAVGAIGASTAVWASKNSPEIKAEATINDATNQTIEEIGGSASNTISQSIHYFKYDALLPDEKELVTKELGLYEPKGYDNLVPYEKLTPAEQTQVTKEDGIYTSEVIDKLK
ncbi:M56 family metallopeptidase [Paenibacillus lactis]|uniref:M56 family metallopeptidase n=1 Tax=Paenibacillus lactis TaxID=228574 RepID=UPI0004902AFF|nr:M56 family metallopeptidase [Paenibacillus lactis]MCM3494704.1 M56 family metallopeptidase [Paenibacillus lactis]